MGVWLPCNTHGNSLIIYRCSGDRSSAPWRAGKIVSIFVSKQPPRDSRSLMIGPLFVVSDYRPLSNEEASHDWYRKYGDAGGRLFHAVHDSSVLLSMRDIICHFACTAMTLPELEGDFIHVLPLLRVGTLLPLDTAKANACLGWSNETLTSLWFEQAV